jgi:hypothetical protein
LKSFDLLALFRHVWTAPAVQEESDISAKRSGAAMYPAFECGHYGRWP